MDRLANALLGYMPNQNALMPTMANSQPQGDFLTMAGSMPPPSPLNALRDPQFYGDIYNRLAAALRGGVADVLPTGAGPIVARNMGVPADPNYRSKMTDLGLAGLTVYHGSPYKFDKFDMSKIGTGEGAQAYGHGLYFAEHPSVAKQYQEFLSSRGNDLTDPGNLAASLMYRTKEGTREAGILEAKAALNGIKNYPNAYKHDPFAQTRIEKALEILESGAALPKQGGNFYRVDLPDDQIAKMLDWDKPLSQQAPEIASAISASKIPEIWKKQIGHPIEKSAPQADLMYKVLSDELGQAGATQYLRSLGIPGIRYLDQGSRSTGKGTSNFVVFDDSLPKIIGRE